MEFLKCFCMFAYLSSTEVFGINFTISNDKILVGSKGMLTMSCDITEKDVETVYLIQIQRGKLMNLSEIDNLEWETLAIMESNENATLSPDITASNKDYIVDGAWNFTSPSSTYLTLSMNISKLDCADSRSYRCELLYKSNITSASKNYEMNRNMSVFVKPRVISLTGTRNGVLIQGPSLSEKAIFDIGDELELSCTANIGSFPDTKIRWNKTSQDASINDFVEYQPEVCTFDEGTADTDDQCGYIRTARIKYTVLVTELDRANGIAFECYVTVNEDPYRSFTTLTNPRFYLKAGDNVISENESNEQILSLGTIFGTVIGAFVAGVVITIVILRRKKILKVRSRNMSNAQDSSVKSNYENLQLRTREQWIYVTVRT